MKNMISFRDLTCEQLQALAVMADFHCEGIPCKNCPLFSQEHSCGSRRAELIIDQYEKEIKG